MRRVLQLLVVGAGTFALGALLMLARPAGVSPALAAEPPVPAGDKDESMDHEDPGHHHHGHLADHQGAGHGPAGLGEHHHHHHAHPHPVDKHHHHPH